MRILLLAVLVLVFATPAHTVPFTTSEFGTVPQRGGAGRDDQCHLQYFNYCSGWVWYWSGYCYGMFFDFLPVKYGTCFDLADCPGACRQLEDVWFASRNWGGRARVDVEIYCANHNQCPVGPPLAGFYQTVLHTGYPWSTWNFGGLPLCPCEETGSGTFIVMIRDYTASVWNSPYSDRNPMNVDVGCESEWRCGGHSFMYKNVQPYCDIYGLPAPMWVSYAGGGCTNFPAIPLGCHDYWYDTGCYVEWLIDCYVSCQGATDTEQKSWSEIKNLYK
jgi:hypothetical protein